MKTDDYANSEVQSRTIKQAKQEVIDELRYRFAPHEWLNAKDGVYLYKILDQLEKEL